MIKQTTGPDLLNRPDATGLAANIGLAVGAVLVVNGLIFGLGWNNSNSPEGSLTPPGWLVGTVWTGLFIGLGVARWLLMRSGDPKASQYGWLVIGLGVFCLAYPFYTLAPDSKTAGLVGNLLTIGLAGFIAWKIRQASPVAAGLVGLVILWVSFATVTIVVP